ncbi:NADPH-dependent FMN reductase [Schaalia vaccimaxillae]|uniref:NADPH-dependent FMN reductase n=1 Tax=Schaalia vaccimaxillae TaxID=183916 RepID=UPI0003B54D15|nr:NAD(P)H-dependent oxidoreductase [Schaalia vaccimaxillae]
MTRIAVVLGSVRPNRIGADVAQWVVSEANTVEGVQAELVDLADFKLPLFAEPMSPAMAEPKDPEGARFNSTIKGFDGVVFVTPEYNHAIPGALKNATDFLQPQALAHKGVGIVSYGFASGVRAAENLRLVLANFEAAIVNSQVMLSIPVDFEDMSIFNPASHHDGEVSAMVEAIVARSEALADLR